VGNALPLQKLSGEVSPIAHGVYQRAVHIKNGVFFVHTRVLFVFFFIISRDVGFRNQNGAGFFSLNWEKTCKPGIHCYNKSILRCPANIFEV
jgi:hypothetical protein